MPDTSSQQEALEEWMANAIWDQYVDMVLLAPSASRPSEIEYKI